MPRILLDWIGDGLRVSRRDRTQHGSGDRLYLPIVLFVKGMVCVIQPGMNNALKLLNPA
ncbi:MAG: hypothetical protein WBG38_14090 [Nodosilinea sp.]